MTRKVTIKWNQLKDRWDLYHYKKNNEQFFVMDFPPCENMLLYFKPDKDKDNHYELIINRILEIN